MFQDVMLATGGADFVAAVRTVASYWAASF
jgi:hypothetical protein